MSSGSVFSFTKLTNSKVVSRNRCGTMQLAAFPKNRPIFTLRHMESLISSIIYILILIERKKEKWVAKSHNYLKVHRLRTRSQFWKPKAQQRGE